MNGLKYEPKLCETFRRFYRSLLVSAIRWFCYLPDWSVECRYAIKRARLLFRGIDTRPVLRRFFAKTVRDKLEGLAITSIYYGLCWVAFIVAVLLLCIGLWNATLALSEKGFYGVTFFMTLFGAIAVQKNTRDSAMSSDTESASLFKKVRDQLKAED